MKDMDLAELRHVAETQRIKKNKKLRERYALAKSLGFASSEAMILQHKTEQVIRKLAQKLGDKNDEISTNERLG